MQPSPRIHRYLLLTTEPYPSRLCREPPQFPFTCAVHHVASSSSSPKIQRTSMKSFSSDSTSLSLHAPRRCILLSRWTPLILRTRRVEWNIHDKRSLIWFGRALALSCGDRGFFMCMPLTPCNLNILQGDFSCPTTHSRTHEQEFSNN